ADVIMGQSPKSEFYNKEHKGLPFHQGVGSYGARFVQDDTYSTSFTKVAEANSILFSVRAPVGRLNITKNKIVIGRGIAAINSKSGFQSYLFYALKERFFKDDILGNGAIFASISKNELLNQVFVIPDAKIMSAYEKIAAALDKKIEVVDMQLQQLVEARDRLLPKLMNGEIEV
ncbi:restriction endonuclease subunit S, partial [Eubacterium ventriosum]